MQLLYKTNNRLCEHMKPAALLFLLSIWGLCCAKTAEMPETLFTIEVKLKNSSREERNEAIRTALSTVLSRMIENKQSLQTESVQKLLSQSSLYVNQFHYRILDPIQSEKELQTFLKITFDADALQQVLINHSIRFLPSVRPPVLIILLIETPSGKNTFDPDLMPELAGILKQSSQQWGLTLVFPIQELPGHDLLANQADFIIDRDKLNQIKAQYRLDTILSGIIRLHNDCWLAHWFLLSKLNDVTWSGNCQTLKIVVDTAMQKLYDTLFNLYAQPAVTKELVMKISGIKGHNDMIRFKKFLLNLATVDTITGLRVKSGYYFFHLILHSDPTSLQQELKNKGLILKKNNTKKTGIAEYTIYLN